MSSSAPTAVSDSERLIQLAGLATDLGLSSLREEAIAAADRVGGRRFYVACVGQFKRGKSTLIDALLNDTILPVGVVPITAIPTVVRFGATRSARVRLSQDEGAEPLANEWVSIPLDEIAQYVSEERNPGNMRGVVAVEVFHPSELLSSGMCLVDTPGLGSVFDTNTLATREFVPHIDAAIVVFGADPPITGDELTLIASVAEHVPDLIFVLNKADRVSSSDLRQAELFAQRVIADRLAIPAPHIFVVSAAERLSRADASRDWNDMLAALNELAHRRGTSVVRQSGQRAVRRIANALLAAVQEEGAALHRSRAETSAHMERLAALIAHGERMLQDLSALFAAESSRLSMYFASRRRAFLDHEQSRARGILIERTARLVSRYGPRLRRQMMREAQHVAEETLRPWMSAEQAEANQIFRQSMTRFLEMAQSLVERLIASGFVEAGGLQPEIDPDVIDLDGRSRFVFNYVIHVAEPASPIRFGADLAIGALLRSPFTNAATSFLHWLLEMNSSRVQGDVEQRVGEGARRLEQYIRRKMADIQSWARELAARAEAIRADGAEAIQSTDRRLHEMQDRVEAIARSAEN